MKKNTAIAFSTVSLICIDTLYLHAHTADLEENKQSFHSSSTMSVSDLSIKSINEIKLPISSSLECKKTELLSTNHEQTLIRFKEGLKYELGIGGVLNEERALEHYKCAADLGHREAQFKCGLFYLKSLSVPDNLSISFEYFKLAANQGHAKAQFSCAKLYYSGKGVPKNLPESFGYTKLAADQGHAEAQYNCGICYSQGIGVPENLSEAFRFTQLAADQGYARAQAMCGQYFYEGIIVPQNFREAFRYSKLAADKGHAKSQFNCGSCYNEGKGVPKNRYEAIKYYTLAAKQGHTEAQVLCAALSILENTTTTDNLVSSQDQTRDMKITTETLLEAEERVTTPPKTLVRKKKKNKTKKRQANSQESAINHNVDSDGEENGENNKDTLQIKPSITSDVYTEFDDGSTKVTYPDKLMGKQPVDQSCENSILTEPADNVDKVTTYSYAIRVKEVIEHNQLLTDINTFYKVRTHWVEVGTPPILIEAINNLVNSQLETNEVSGTFADDVTLCLFLLSTRFPLLSQGTTDLISSFIHNNYVMNHGSMKEFLETVRYDPHSSRFYAVDLFINKLKALDKDKTDKIENMLEKEIIDVKNKSTFDHRLTIIRTEYETNFIEISALKYPISLLHLCYDTTKQTLDELIGSVASVKDE